NGACGVRGSATVTICFATVTPPHRTAAPDRTLTLAASTGRKGAFTARGTVFTAPRLSPAHVECHLRAPSITGAVMHITRRMLVASRLALGGFAIASATACSSDNQDTVGPNVANA